MHACIHLLSLIDYVCRACAFCVCLLHDLYFLHDLNGFPHDLCFSHDLNGFPHDLCFLHDLNGFPHDLCFLHDLNGFLHDLGFLQDLNGFLHFGISGMHVCGLFVSLVVFLI
jgi:hypothetical protein